MQNRFAVARQSRLKRCVLLTLLIGASAFAQVSTAGKQRLSGKSSLNLPLQSIIGGPLTYSGRTDNCVTGSESGCVAGRTAGETGSALVFQNGPSDPLPFKGLDDPTSPAAANTSFVDPDFGTYEVWVTDQSTQSATTDFSMGSAGGWDAFNRDSTLLTFVNSGSVSKLAHIIKSRVLAQTCSPANPCIVMSNLTGSATPDSTHFDNNAGLAFSRNPNDPSNTMYEGSPTHISKLTINVGVDGSGNPTGVDSITRVTYVDFTSDSPTPCKVLPSDYVPGWQGMFSVSSSGETTLASAGGGSYQTIGSGTGGPQALTPDTFIMPVNNQPAGSTHWMFQASNGTTSGTEPNWAASCPTQGSTCSDGTVTWTNIGKVWGQGPGFDVVHFDPQRGCSRDNTRLTKRYRGTNEGPNYPNAGTPDPAGQWITDDATVCLRMGGSNCGTGGTVALTDAFTLHAADQKLQGRYYGMGVTGGGAINKNWAGSGSNLTAAPVGSCLPPINNSALLGQWNSSTTYTNNQVVWDTDTVYYQANGTVAASATHPGGNVGTASGTWLIVNSYCYSYISDAYSNLVRPIIELGPDYGADGHNAMGYLYDYRGGAYYAHYFNQPNCQDTTCDTTNYGSGKPNGSAYVGAPNPGTQLLPIGLCSDAHPTYRGVGLADLQPIILPTSVVAAWGGIGQPLCSGSQVSGCSPYVCASYNEIVAISTDGSQSQTRLGHNYNTGSNSGFGIQNAIAVESQDGTFVVYTTDGGNTRGDDVTGAATCAHPLRAQYTTSSGQTVTYGDYVLPVTSNAAQNIYQITGGSTCTATGTTCTEGTSPNWNSSCANAGGVCTDGNGVQFTNVGPNTCRGDVVLAVITSAHPAP